MARRKVAARPVSAPVWNGHSIVHPATPSTPTAANPEPDGETPESDPISYMFTHPEPTKTRAPFTFWPVTEEVHDFGIHKWPDVGYLAYLEESEIKTYREKYAWVTKLLEPITRLDGMYEGGRFKMELIWEEWETYECRRYKNKNTLSSTFLRDRNIMLDLIRRHNDRVAGKSLEDRAARTISHLKTFRREVWVPDQGRAEVYVPYVGKFPVRQPVLQNKALVPTGDKIRLVLRNEPVIHGVDYTKVDPEHWRFPLLPDWLQEKRRVMDPEQEVNVDSAQLPAASSNAKATVSPQVSVDSAQLPTASSSAKATVPPKVKVDSVPLPVAPSNAKATVPPKVYSKPGELKHKEKITSNEVEAASVKPPRVRLYPPRRGWAERAALQDEMNQRSKCNKGVGGTKDGQYERGGGGGGIAE